MKKIKIEIPDGYEIDKDKSTFEEIVFKKSEVKTWEEIVIQKIANKEKVVYISDCNEPDTLSLSLFDEDNLEELKDILPNERTAERIVALCQMFIIAEHYNDGWIPNFSTPQQVKFSPVWSNSFDSIDISACLSFSHAVPYFKSKGFLLEAYLNNKEIFETALKP